MQVTWKLSDGTEITAEVAAGTHLMQAGLDNNVTGIVGACGGNMSCATCHVLVAPEWHDRTGPPNEVEDMTLDLTESERQDTSRLSCQIEMHARLDGLVLVVPKG